jgi:hypothetical protein
MIDYAVLLSGGDLRSAGKSNTIVHSIRTQPAFDELFLLLFHKDRKVVMRAADAIEKISITKPGFLLKHKFRLLKLLNEAENKELKWHLAQIIPRLPLSEKKTDKVFKIFSGWLMNRTESKIVRVNALQAIADLSIHNRELRKKMMKLISHADFSTAPSLKARLKKITAKSST